MSILGVSDVYIYILGGSDVYIYIYIYIFFFKYIHREDPMYIQAAVSISIPFWRPARVRTRTPDMGGSGGSYMAARPRCVFPGLLCLHMGPLGRRRLGPLSL